MLGVFWRLYQRPLSWGRWGVRTFLVAVVGGAAFFQLGVVSDPMRIYGKDNWAKHWRPAADLPERDFLRENYLLDFTGQEGIKETDLWGDRIGSSMTAGGNWLIVGANRDSRRSAPLHGWAYAFRFSEEADEGRGRWLRNHDIPPPGQNGGGQFGRAMKLRGPELVIEESRGKLKHVPCAIGQVHFFELREGKWTHRDTLKPPPVPDWTIPEHRSNLRERAFGTSFSWDGSRIFVNAPDEWNGPTRQRGAWYFYERGDAGNWILRQRGPAEIPRSKKIHVGGIGPMAGNLATWFCRNSDVDSAIRPKLMRWEEPSGQWRLLDPENDPKKIPLRAPPLKSKAPLILLGVHPHIFWTTEAEQGWLRWDPQLPEGDWTRISVMDSNPRFGILCLLSSPLEVLVLFFPAQDKGLSPRPLLLKPRQLWSPPIATLADNGDIFIGDIQQEQTYQLPGQISVFRRTSIVAKLASTQATVESKTILPRPTRQ